ncbi:EFR1 family ferrodoxin [Candidatus Dependentiae bacterium]|nr:EFR1 family ferrodoxin [Candidatus Dependentiae bacterium]
MKGLIFYYSTTGNTKLACEYIQRKSTKIDFELISMLDAIPDLEKYDFVGFALWVDFLGPPKFFYDFLEKLPRQNNKPGFVFCTAGAMPGRTLKIMRKRLLKKGYRILIGDTLIAPDNCPLLVSRGRIFKDHPSEKQLEKFNEFIMKLNELGVSISNEEIITPQKIKIGFLNSLSPVWPRILSRKIMGKKFVDEELCTQCGICEKGCAYKAIELKPYPVFNEKLCFACWGCYNTCPTKAIYTKRYKNKGHYKIPVEYKEKL